MLINQIFRIAKKASFPEIFNKFAGTPMESTADETWSPFDAGILYSAAGRMQ